MRFQNQKNKNRTRTKTRTQLGLGLWMGSRGSTIDQGPRITEELKKSATDELRQRIKNECGNFQTQGEKQECVDEILGLQTFL